jgi:hypothetical protein
MSDAATALREPWPALEHQREGVTVGIWLFIASAVLFRKTSCSGPWEMTSVHAIHLATGIGIVGVFAFMLWCRLLPIESPAMLGVATYWHFIDTVSIVLFPLLQGRIVRIHALVPAASDRVACHAGRRALCVRETG